MPYRVYTLDQVADYLHLSRSEVERLVKDRQIPFVIQGGHPIFRATEIEAWASQRILGLQDSRLTEYHRQTTQGTRQVFAHEALLPELIQPEFIAPRMTAKTKASIVRDMVALADTTSRLNDPKEFIESLEAREGLCSTAVPGGIALMHARSHDPYRFESSFIVLGRTIQAIHFGAPDGQPTDLFFLIASQDDRLHLHTLARLCLMAQNTAILDDLRQAPDAQTMFESLLAAETEALATRKPSKK